MLQYKRNDSPMSAYELLHGVLQGRQKELFTIFVDTEYNMRAESFERN